ncbi:transposase [Kitasatospora sp. GAS204B]|uniref:transposase n=1 Tax=unclassified Kitasatospora TaxID=2633591 RepID=UPI002473E05F|nr:transposase [Kitasatospora sp. GAS204B]MDH6122852.1 transposase InsO family protein [Kitasatospora sp. GAS204B]
MPAHSPFTVVWDKNQRAALEQLVHSRTAPLRRIQRAAVALAAADGVANAAIARSHRLLDGSIDPALTIQLVLDNGSSHVSKATRAWIAAHPRFTVHHTPKHASWLNQVEIFFSILARRLLRRGEFTSRDDLIDQIRDFTIAYDNEARPFRWTYDGTPLKAT